MSEKQGYDVVKYNSGYEQEHDRRRSRIRGYEPYEMPVESDSDSGDGGFVERNNIQDRS